jgi:hypothetical protein
VLLSGCDMIGGALGIESPEKTAAARDADGRAIGGACRHAGRAIEDCFALNKRADRAAVFAGWRDMNDYMRENKIESVTPQLANAGAKAAVEPESEPAKASVAQDKAAAKGETAKAHSREAAPARRAPRDPAGLPLGTADPFQRSVLGAIVAIVAALAMGRPTARWRSVPATARGRDRWIDAQPVAAILASGPLQSRPIAACSIPRSGQPQKPRVPRCPRRGHRRGDGGCLPAPGHPGHPPSAARGWWWWRCPPGLSGYGRGRVHPFPPSRALAITT